MAPKLTAGREGTVPGPLWKSGNGRWLTLSKCLTLSDSTWSKWMHLLLSRQWLPRTLTVMMVISQPFFWCTPIPKDSPFPLGSVFGFLFTGLCLDHLITSIWMTQVFISSPDLSPESQAQTLNSYRHPSSEFNSTLASVSPHCRTQGSKLMAACTLLAVSRCRPSVPSSTHAPCPLHPCSISPHLLPSMHIT